MTRSCPLGLGAAGALLRRWAANVDSVVPQLFGLGLAPKQEFSWSLGVFQGFLFWALVL